MEKKNMMKKKLLVLLLYLQCLMAYSYGESSSIQFLASRKITEVEGVKQMWRTTYSHEDVYAKVGYKAKYVLASEKLKDGNLDYSAIGYLKDITSKKEKFGPAQILLAYCYFEKQVDRTNLTEQQCNAIAYELAQKALVNKEYSACNIIGCFLLTGTVVPKDEKKGIEMLELGVQNDDPLSMVTLAKCYLNGTGVDRNYIMVESLLDKAAELHYHQGSEIRLRLNEIQKEKRRQEEREKERLRELAEAKKAKEQEAAFEAFVNELGTLPESVDNPILVNNTPGALEATIRTKGNISRAKTLRLKGRIYSSEFDLIKQFENIVVLDLSDSEILISQKQKEEDVETARAELELLGLLWSEAARQSKNANKYGQKSYLETALYEMMAKSHNSQAKAKAKDLLEYLKRNIYWYDEDYIKKNFPKLKKCIAPSNYSRRMNKVAKNPRYAVSESSQTNKKNTNTRSGDKTVTKKASTTTSSHVQSSSKHSSSQNNAIKKLTVDTQNNNTVSKTASPAIDENAIYEEVDQSPEFPGGRRALFQFLSQNVNYPKQSEENGVQGRVIVAVVIEKDGSLSDLKIKKSVDPLLDQEALRVVKTMPKFSPGKKSEKIVRVRFNIPIEFRLR